MIYFILILIAAISKAFMDNLKDGYNFGSSLWFSNLNLSWKNKYEANSLKARFFGSTTFLVWLTDFWHFAQMIMLMCFFTFLYLAPLSIVETVFSFVLFLVLFEISFRALREKVKINNTDFFILGILSMIFGAIGLQHIIFNTVFLWQVLINFGVLNLAFLFIKGLISVFKHKHNELN